MLVALGRPDGCNTSHRSSGYLRRVGSVSGGFCWTPLLWALHSRATAGIAGLQLPRLVSKGDEYGSWCHASAAVQLGSDSKGFWYFSVWKLHLFSVVCWAGTQKSGEVVMGSLSRQRLSGDLCAVLVSLSTYYSCICCLVFFKEKS